MHEVIALDLATSRYIGLNPTGAVLWQALAHGADEADLVWRLVESFDVGPAEAAEHVESFVAEMASRQLVTAEAEASTAG